LGGVGVRKEYIRNAYRNFGGETSLERHRARARRWEDSIKTLNIEINLNNI
jgi:hypothetical protein